MLFIVHTLHIYNIYYTYCLSRNLQIMIPEKCSELLNQF